MSFAVLIKNFEDARPVVRWFNAQQKVGGGYGSTQVTQNFLSIKISQADILYILSAFLYLPHFSSLQATIMVYQAVAEYWINANEPQYDLNVDIKLPGRSAPEKYNFNQNNHYATRTSKVRRSNTNTVTM